MAQYLIMIPCSFIATQLCAATLYEWVEGTYKGPEIRMNERNILHQVTTGLAYLHSKKIIHRDIKPTNILILVPDNTSQGPNNDPLMKIADFGLSKVLKSDKVDLSTKNKTNPRGTRGWIAPELYVRGRRYGIKVDIFPLGCVFGYTLSTKKQHPFGEEEERVSRIKKKEEPLSIRTLEELKESYAKNCTLELIWSMIEMNPEERPTAEEVLKHEFFTAGNSDGPTSSKEFLFFRIIN